MTTPPRSSTGPEDESDSGTNQTPSDSTAAPLTSEWERQLDAAMRRDDPHADTKTIEWERLGLVKRLYSTLLKGEFRAWSEFCAPDFFLEIVGPQIVPFVGKWVGLEEVYAATLRNFAFLQQQQVQFEIVAVQGDKLIIVAFEQGIYRMTGKPYATHFIHCFFFKDDKLAGCREFVDGLRLAESMQVSAATPAVVAGDQFTLPSGMA